MEVFLIRLLQFMLAISLLVLLHEGGHFFFSKLFGVRVEKFYLFFDLGIGKWKGQLFKFKPKKSDTEYGVGWLPLGGYCKIAGMIDESFDTEQMKQPEQPWEFRSKPTWQRLLIMIGGVLVNFVLALFIYAMVLFTWGDSYMAMNDMSMGMKFNQTAKEIGFQDGDMLMSYDGKPFGRYDVDVYRHMADAKTVTVRREGKEIVITMPEDLSLLTMLQEEPQFARPFIPAEIDSIIPGTPAEKAGLHKGDIVRAINGAEVDSWNEFTHQTGIIADRMTEAKTTKDSLSLRQITLVVERASQTHRDSPSPAQLDAVSPGQATTDTISLTLSPDLLMGVGQTSLYTYYEPTKVEYGFFESLPAGVKYGWNILRGYVNDLKYVFTADGAKSLGGFGAIGSLFPESWDWHRFWLMTAFLSIILAFMNILPIPALDGGHVLFLLYEIITRRKPSETFMIRAEYVGFGILILLMVVANLNDILRWLGYL